MFEQAKLVLSGGRMVALGLEATGASLLRALTQRRPELESPCYPIVLMHGFAGFRELGIGSLTILEYYNGVRQLLGQMGYRVFAPEVAPFDDPLARAQQWLGHMEAIRKQTGAEKVHLVGHSQGGLDARALVAPTGSAEDTPIGALLGLGYGPHVASLTTIGTPHTGNVLADAVQQDDPALQHAIDTLLGTVSLLARMVTGDPQDAQGAVQALSRAFMLKYFNRIIKDDPDVPCFAIAGDPGALEFVSPLMRLTYPVLNEIDVARGGGPNDGFVTLESALFGNISEAYAALGGADGVERRDHWQVLGVVQADHVGQVGIPLQLMPSTAFDHLALFAGLAQFLDPTYIGEMSLQKDGRWHRKPKPSPVPA